MHPLYEAISANKTIISSRSCSVQLFFTRFQNMNSDTKLTATEATDKRTLASSMPPRPQTNGTCPGPGFGPKSWKQVKFDLAYPSKTGSTRQCMKYRTQQSHLHTLDAKGHTLWTSTSSCAWVCFHRYITGPSLKVVEKVIGQPQPTFFEPLLLKGAVGAQAGWPRAETYV